MPLTTVSGDPLLTKQPFLAFGINAAGRTETTALVTALRTRFPAAFASYEKQCRQGRIQPGTIWFWRESMPALALMVVRETPVGAARLRYVDAAIMTLARDYRLEGISGIAIAPLGAAHENTAISEIVARWLAKTALSVTLYTAYQPGEAAE